VVSWPERSLIEWSENATQKPVPELLKQAESKIALLPGPDSPAAIIIFSVLYNSSPSAAEFPNISSFIIKMIQTDFAKTGIELATAHTATQKVDASSVPGALPNGVPSDRNLRSGIFAKDSDGKKM
jgi:hypothetical protein